MINLLGGITERTSEKDYLVKVSDKNGNLDEIYSFDLQNKMIWDSMKADEKKMLKRYNELCQLSPNEIAKNFKQEFFDLFNWVSLQELSGLEIPEHQRV